MKIDIFRKLKLFDNLFGTISLLYNENIGNCLTIKSLLPSYVRKKTCKKLRKMRSIYGHSYLTIFIFKSGIVFEIMWKIINLTCI